MDTSLMINSTNAGKKYQKAIANVNPEKSNAILEEFAQKLTGLSTNTYVGASRVDKSDVTEEGGGSTPVTPAKTEPTLTIDTSEGGGSYTYNGDGIVFGYAAWNGDGSSPLKFKLDRSAKTFNVFPDSGYDYHIWIYASEGDTYAAKTAHGSYQD